MERHNTRYIEGIHRNLQQVSPQILLLCRHRHRSRPSPRNDSWDDDIDVLMPRPDYDRLLEIAKHEDFGKYEVVTPYNNESYPLYFSKLVNRETTLIEEKERPCIIGLYVDIFLLMPPTMTWKRQRRCIANTRRPSTV